LVGLVARYPGRWPGLVWTWALGPETIADPARC